ncbi:MAG: ATP-binding protein [bacterium]
MTALRLRSILMLIALFAAVVFVMAYLGIDASRSNMLRVLTRQGESLMQSLIISAGNNVAASVIVEQATADHLVPLAATLGTLIDQGPGFRDSLAVWQRRFDLERVDLIDGTRSVVASSWPETVGELVDSLDERAAALDSVLAGLTEVAVCRPATSVLPREDFIKVAVETRSGVLLLQGMAGKLTDYQESLGIGYLVRQLGSQRGIAYVVLQADEGIVLASEEVDWMTAIDADTFLINAINSGQAATRLTDYGGREILEVVRSFRSDALPSALFRMGLSLYSYRQQVDESTRQLIILSAALFILGVVGFWAATWSRRARRAAVDLQRLQSLTDEIVTAVETAVVATDREGRITIFNPHAEKLFGLVARGALARSYLELFPDDELQLEKIRQRPGSVVRDEVELRRGDGVWLELLVAATPLYSEERSYSGSVALAYDLTEQKRVAESTRVRERLAELGNLAAGVAHEIRNPLNSISIAVQRLQHEFQPSENPEDYAHFLRTVTDEIKRLDAIIRDFLALARGGKVDKVLVDVQVFIDEIASLLRLEAESRNLSLSVKAEAGLNGRFDREEMKKVLINLLRNAVAAADDGGRVEVRANRVAGDKVELLVSNTGASISPELRDKIFRPYFTTKSEGTGLGLAICHRIVADHGGTIELLAGEPTTFRVVV